MADLTISVIMPVYNGMNYIVKSLSPLVEMLKRGEVEEVIVVDDSSTDGSAKEAASLGTCVIPTGGRLGPGAARNKAADIARGDILWFVDVDVVAHEDVAREYLKIFRDDKVVAAFGSYDDAPPADNFLSQYKNLVHHFYHQGGQREVHTFWAGCGAVRKEAFIEAGGFDVEKFTRPSIEDIELGHRLIKRGGSIILASQVQVTHLKEWHLMNLLHTEIFCRALPWARLMLTETGMVNDLNVGLGERFRATVAGLFILSLFLAIFGQVIWWLPILFFFVVYLVNRTLFHLFIRKNGSLFALSGLLFHQLYYFYSSLSFVWCFIEIKYKNHSRVPD
jgi:glycosyltransferase involved in cell wall biosynthesis